MSVHDHDPDYYFPKSPVAATTPAPTLPRSGVRVVSDGPVKVERVVCQRCHYMLEYTPLDVRRGSYMGDATGFVDCPRDGCGASMAVS